MLEVWMSAGAWISLVTLAALEIVLGIDNIVFISILASRLPQADQPRARRMGLAFALVTRLGLLFGIALIMRLTAPLFTIAAIEFSGRSLILLVGGLFLIGKSTLEIFTALEVEEEHGHKTGQAPRSFAFLILQIALLDVVFSLDSVITAVGMVQHVSIMAAAMILAVGVMLLFANPIGDFVTRHPSMKVLALAFLLLVGVMLMAEGLGQHVPKGYIYFAMAFSLGIELINMRMRKKRQKAVVLHPSAEVDLID